MVVDIGTAVRANCFLEEEPHALDAAPMLLGEECRRGCDGDWAHRSHRLELAPKRTLVVFGLLQGVLQLHKQARHAAVIDLDHLARSGLVTLLLGYGAKVSRVEAAAALALSNEHREGTRGGTK